MADSFTENLPGFKKKRQGLASRLRDYFAKRIKKNNSDVSNETPGGSLGAPTEAAIRKEMAPASLANSLGETKSPATSSFAADSFSMIRQAAEAGSSRSSLIDDIKIPKAEKKKAPVKISADAPKEKGVSVDKGFPKEDPSIYTRPDIKEQTRVKDKFKLQLRYTMPKKLQTIPKKDLANLSQWIGTQIIQIERERSEYMERLLRYRAMWLDFVSTGMQPVFEGAHNVHIPVIFEKIKAMHSRIYQAILGIDPPFSLKPRDVVSEKQKYEKEQLLSYIIKDYANLGRGWEETVDRDIWNFVADGTAITKQDWKRDVRKFSDVKDEFSGFQDGEAQFKQTEVETEKVIYDGPMMKTVPLEDFYIAGVNVASPDEADLIGDREFYTKSDLIKLSQQNFFYPDAIQKVLATEPLNQNQITSLDYTTFKNQEKTLAGVDREVSGHKAYEIFNICCRWDIDQDGIDEELMLWYERNSQTILRMTYLERASPGAIRPYSIKRFIARPGTPFGIGMAEMLYGINNAQDYIVNQRLDFGTIRNLPFGFVRAASGQKPKEMRLAPGTLYPLDNPQQDVYFPPMNGGTAYGFQEEEKIEGYGDKVSSISGFNLGSTASQGATRTATGAAGLISEINTNIDIHIKRYQRGYKRNLYILDKQIQQLLPLGTVIRILGPDGKILLGQFENRKALEFSSDFELTANSVSSNKAIERDTANMLLNIMQNPLALQAGLVTPQNLYNVYRNLLQKAEIKDIDAYITRPEGTEQSPYTAKDELTMILGGVKPPIYLLDRHGEKLAFFDAFENSDDLSWYGPEQLELYRQTKKEHQDMMNAVAAQMPLQGQNTTGPMQQMAASQLAAGGGVPQQKPAQQQMNLAPQSSPRQSQ